LRVQRRSYMNIQSHSVGKRHIKGVPGRPERFGKQLARLALSALALPDNLDIEVQGASASACQLPSAADICPI
jgi:hypothetical protein